MFLYHSINYLLVLAILVSPYVPNGLKIIIATSTIAIGTTVGIIRDTYLSRPEL